MSEGGELPEELKALIDERLAEGVNREEIISRLKRLDRLAREEHLGLIERVTQPDGSAVIHERDPFEHLPTTEDSPDS